MPGKYTRTSAASGSLWNGVRPCKYLTPAALRTAGPCYSSGMSIFERFLKKTVQKEETVSGNDAAKAAPERDPISDALETMGDTAVVLGAGLAVGAAGAAVELGTHPDKAQEVLNAINTALPGQYEQLTPDQMKAMQSEAGKPRVTAHVDEGFAEMTMPSERK